MQIARLASWLLVALFQWGCASIPVNESGEPAITWKTVKDAAVQSATSKHTWVPLLGAAVFSINDLDERTSDWATEKTPLFGDIENAEDWSDRLNDLGKLGMAVSSFMVPAPDNGPTLKRNSGRLAINLAALEANRLVTSELKSIADRERPDGSDDRSFPSGHSSRAGTQAAINRYNIRQISRLSEREKRYWEWASTGTAALAAWGRVEGQRHYPSDVLAGYALGNFVGTFVSHAFVEPLLDTNTEVDIALSPDGAFFVGFSRAW